MHVKKTILIKTNLLTIVIVCIVVALAALLYVTNGVQNLFFATMSTNQVASVAVNERSSEESAMLSADDIARLVPLLQGVRLKGRSVRLFSAETMNSQYTVRLKSGVCFDVACYSDHYIINGRGYAIPEGHKDDNYSHIVRLYQEHLDDREYFPRESRGG